MESLLLGYLVGAWIAELSWINSWSTKEIPMCVFLVSPRPEMCEIWCLWFHKEQVLLLIFLKIQEMGGAFSYFVKEQSENLNRTSPREIPWILSCCGVPSSLWLKEKKAEGVRAAGGRGGVGGGKERGRGGLLSESWSPAEERLGCKCTALPHPSPLGADKWPRPMLATDVGFSKMSPFVGDWLMAFMMLLNSAYVELLLFGVLYITCYSCSRRVSLRARAGTQDFWIDRSH